MTTPPPPLPEPAKALVGRIVKNTHAPMPWEVNAAIDTIRLEIDAGVRRLDEERTRLPHLARTYRAKKARAFLTGTGTVKDREAQAELASLSERMDVEVCEQTIHAGRENLDALRTGLSALQTINAQIRTEMTALTGFGGRP
ncbi:hypothetical protein [Nocardiopsis sp. LOL_012]|uniref:hypothetical protein n=1 Tax=Nocardiopsis sp. LOL_012 TaxID=3345409 RepID=UPI003A8676B2